MIIATTVRNRDSKVFANIAEFGRQSLRKIAQATGLSKSSVARSMRAQDKRDKHPEAHLWETEEGQTWLRILVIAMIYIFGLKGNQGAERMSEFLKCIRVDTHVGVSPSALRKMIHQIEELLVEFQKIQEAEQGSKEDQEREIVASGDETWFNKWLGRSLHGKLGRASKQLNEAKAKLLKLEEKGAAPDKIASQKQRVKEKQEKLDIIEVGKQAYSEVQRSISATVHAFSVKDNQPQSSEQVEGYEGTRQINLLIVARAILGYSRRELK